MADAHLHLSEGDGPSRRTAVLELPLEGKHVLSYWRHDGELASTSANPFLVGFFLMLMERHQNVVVHGEVSETLLMNLDELQEVWQKWRPDRYGRISIEAEKLSTPKSASNSDDLLAFSCGIDATFALCRQLYWRPARGRSLRGALLINGFDIALSETGAFETARTHAASMLDNTDVEFLTVETDFKSLYQNWPDAFGLAIASCMLQFEDRYSGGVIGSSEDYASLALPYGSSPVTDHLYSTDAMNFRHEGAGYSRLEKIERLLERPEMVNALRFCLRGAERDENCGRCTKCITTMLWFRVATDALPECFPAPVTADLVLGIRVWNNTQLRELQAILTEATSRGIQDHWVAALQQVITTNLATARDSSLWSRRAASGS